MKPTCSVHLFYCQDMNFNTYCLIYYVCEGEKPSRFKLCKQAVLHFLRVRVTVRVFEPSSDVPLGHWSSSDPVGHLRSGNVSLKNYATVNSDVIRMSGE